MPQNVRDKLKPVTPAVAFSETQLFWPARDWHLKETHFHPSAGLLQQIQFNRHTNVSSIEEKQFDCHRDHKYGWISLRPSIGPCFCSVAIVENLQRVEGRILVRGVFRLVHRLPWVAARLHLGDITLYSISSCLCSGLCVSLSLWLGCIMWLMSSGQSAVGTRTCSGERLIGAWLMERTLWPLRLSGAKPAC